MATTFNKDIFSTVYKDDYADSAGFHRILFNSGRTLQARELTQLQTILQTQISRFGNNVFKEGAAVNPGGATINNTNEFVKLNTATNTLPTNLSTIINTEFTGSTSGVQARLLKVERASGSDPDTIYVYYTNTSGATDFTVPTRFTPGENITNGSVTLTVQTTNTTANPATGRAVSLACSPGDFYVLGNFVFAPSQEIFLNKYSPVFTGAVGFVVTQTVVTANDDTSLFDNQGDVPNLSAPGADRYKITLTLTKQEDVDSGDTFVFFTDIVESKIISTASGTDDYNKINDLLALRTKEESGNYIVKNFKIDFTENDSDTSILNLKVSDGIAYVNGYRAAPYKPTVLAYDKPTTTETINNEVVSASFGNYVLADSGDGLPNINTFKLVNLKNAVNGTGTTIGTAHVRAVEEQSTGIYRVYLFNIQMNAGQSFRDVRSIADDDNYVHNLILELGQAVRKETGNNSLLFPLPVTRPQSLTDISLAVQRRFTTTTDGTGAATITVSGAGETFTNINDWIMAGVDSDIFAPGGITGAGTQSASITGGPASKSIEILAYVNKSAGSVRTKTLNDVTLQDSVDAGTLELNLGKADIYSVDEIRFGDSTGEDISTRFIVDNGQRDNFYALGKLVLKSGFSVPSQQVYVKYKYFSHGVSGDFFAVNSYAGQIDYADIPNHRLSNGTVISLRDVLDFRPIADSDGVFTTTGTGARINELPQNTDLIQFDVTYYEKRNDIIGVDEQGDIIVIYGKPDLQPKFPSVPENILSLYKINMNPNTLNDSDLSITPLDAKRYTMADIAKLEAKIDKLEEVTTLNLLELDTSSLNVLDSAGNQRTKAGFLVDNFANQSFSATYLDDYRASVDPRNKLLRPSFNEDNIRLIYDSDQSSNIIKKGDNLYIKYSEQTYLTQNVISRTENINPFGVHETRGFIELSPASDEWRNTQIGAVKVVSGGTKLNTEQALLWNNWEWNWGGVNLDELAVGDTTSNITNVTTSSTSAVLGTSTTTSRDDAARTTTVTTTQQVENTTATSTTTTVNRVVSESTIREVVGRRVIDVALVPFMRSRKVYFRATNLKPNRRYFPFFDGVKIDSLVKQETFQRFSDLDSDQGRTLDNVTTHPNGSSNLLSNSNGVIEGSFIIPNNSTYRFRTGAREFKLLDISVDNEENALSIAVAKYSAQGTLETLEETVLSTRVLDIVGTQEEETTRISTVTDQVVATNIINDVIIEPADPPPQPARPIRVRAPIRSRRRDPLAQSFFINDETGIFVTKVQLYFSSKDSGNIPAFFEIRPMVNGRPSSIAVVPGTHQSLTPAQIAIPASLTDPAVILATPTTITFEEPVYLSAYTEYALIIGSDSKEYNVFIAQTEDFVLGSTEQRISRQPTLGSLFKSQNSSTWSPAQNQDLAYKIFRADFDQFGEAILENAGVPSEPLTNNPIQLTDGSSTVTVYHPNHGHDVGDTVNIFGLEAGTKYGGVFGASITGNRTITAADNEFYQYAADSAATSSVDVGATDITASRNIMFDVVNPYIENLTVDRTSFAVSGKFTTGKSRAGSETRYQKAASYSVLGNRQNNYFNAPRMIANTANETAELGAGVKSATIKTQLITSDTRVSPVVDLQRTSLTLINNLIDNQDSAATSGFNVPISFVNETSAEGGTQLAKHITVPVTLAEDAVGLNIILAANRPSAANFKLYYRTAGEGEVITDVAFTEVAKQQELPSDENPSIFREYRYLAGGQGGNLTPFTQFQLKLVMTSTNTSRVPVIRDLRVIALVD